MKLRRSFSAAIICLSFVAGTGCDQTDPSERNARITENGVDGVKFGDTIIDIRRILGDPQVISHLDGNLRSWYGAGYEDGEHAGVFVYAINEVGLPDTLAPVDLYAVRAPFPGKTARGIGVGSSAAEVFHAYGSPQDSIVVPLVDGSITRSYYLCMGIRDLEVVIKSDTVSAFFLGFHEPLAGWKTQCQSE